MTETSWQEAFSILGAQPSDPAAVIKRKYRELIRMYHPDGKNGTDAASDEGIRQVITAYETIRRTEHIWNRYDAARTVTIRQNLNAYCERNLYGYIDVFEESPEDIYLKGRGRFIWDPDREDFRLYLKSINEAAGQLIREWETAAGIDDADSIPDPAFHVLRRSVRLKVFHGLVQQFISPLDCLKTMYGGKGTIFTATGRIRYGIAGRVRDLPNTNEILTERELPGIAGIGWPCVMERNRICIVLSSGSGREKRIPLSFDEDSLYYITGALLSRHAAGITAVIDAEQKPGRGSIPADVRIEITDPSAAQRMGNTGRYIDAELSGYKEMLTEYI